MAGVYFLKLKKEDYSLKQLYEKRFVFTSSIGFFFFLTWNTSALYSTKSRQQQQQFNIKLFKK